jgi:hypothetical protein
LFCSISDIGNDGKGFLTGENRNVWDVEKIIKATTIGDNIIKTVINESDSSFRSFIF